MAAAWRGPGYRRAGRGADLGRRHPQCVGSGRDSWSLLSSRRHAVSALNMIRLDYPKLEVARDIDAAACELTPFRDRPCTRTVEIREQLVAEP